MSEILSPRLPAEGFLLADIESFLVGTGGEDDLIKYIYSEIYSKFHVWVTLTLVKRNRGDLNWRLSGLRGKKLSKKTSHQSY